MPKHGLRKHPLYNVWWNMKTRCYRKNYKQYKDWGGRGIRVCEKWINNFVSFYNWAIKNGHAKGLVIDRIDNNGNYEPSNCRFVTRAISGQNKRNILTWDEVREIRNIKLLFGDSISSREIGDAFGISTSEVWNITRNKNWKE